MLHWHHGISTLISICQNAKWAQVHKDLCLHNWHYVETTEWSNTNCLNGVITLLDEPFIIHHAIWYNVLDLILTVFINVSVCVTIIINYWVNTIKAMSGHSFLICWITLHQLIFFLIGDCKNICMVKYIIMCHNFLNISNIYEWPFSDKPSDTCVQMLLCKRNCKNCMY